MTTPVAVIAGAGGAGTATAAALAGAGFHVVALDTRAESADAAIAELPSGQAEAHAIDLLDIAAVQALHDDLVGRLGRVDVVVHLVGGWRGTRSLEVASAENWLALNPPVVGTLAVLTSVFGPTVRASDAGRIFMVTSSTAATPTVGNIAYAAAKRAAEAWMDGLADYFVDSGAASVTVVVKALLTDAMVASDPDKAWPGYTHVRDLAAAISAACQRPVINGGRLDLTAEGIDA